MRLLAVALVAALLGAGCLSGDKPAIKPASSSSSASTQNAVQNATANATATTNATRVETSKGTANTGDQLCLPDPVSGGCADNGFGRGGKAIPLPKGNVTHAKITATWTADSPATQSMALVVIAFHACGGGRCGHGIKYVEGGSPLTLDADTPLKPGESLLATLAAPCHEAGPTETCVGPDQAYTWELTATLAAPASA